ncbi:MAG: hypothetical protein M3494_15205 [Actinomycetota bacterium]|jgi:hypothetical protein|nr:hypothetical protein [Actinomycetota bacterium]
MVPYDFGGFGSGRKPEGEASAPEIRLEPSESSTGGDAGRGKGASRNPPTPHSRDYPGSS